MTSLDAVKDQTLKLRAMIARLVAEDKHRADVIPAGWNNNLRWHVGHLITTPHLLTQALMGEPLTMPAEYRALFAKGTSPAGWQGQEVPPLDTLLGQMTACSEAIFEAFAARADEPFPQPYTTSVGVVLATPAQSLLFSQAHDGIHLGMVMALRRALR